MSFDAPTIKVEEWQREKVYLAAEDRLFLARSQSRFKVGEKKGGEKSQRRPLSQNIRLKYACKQGLECRQINFFHPPKPPKINSFQLNIPISRELVTPYSVESPGDF